MTTRPTIEDAAGSLIATLRQAAEQLLTTEPAGAREIFLAAECSELETDLDALLPTDRHAPEPNLDSGAGTRTVEEALARLARDPGSAGLAGRLHAVLERAGVL